jgi:hypothetical protein
MVAIVMETDALNKKYQYAIECYTIKKETEQWLTQNNIMFIYVMKVSGFNDREIRFTNIEDAMIFKLRWG